MATDCVLVTAAASSVAEFLLNLPGSRLMAPSGRPAGRAGSARRGAYVSDRRQPASESDLLALGRRRSSSPGSLLINSKIFHTLLTALFDVYSCSRNSATQQNVNVKMSLAAHRYAVARQFRPSVRLLHFRTVLNYQTLSMSKCHIVRLVPLF